MTIRNSIANANLRDKTETYRLRRDKKACCSLLSGVMVICHGPSKEIAFKTLNNRLDKLLIL